MISPFWLMKVNLMERNFMAYFHVQFRQAECSLVFPLNIVDFQNFREQEMASSYPSHITHLGYIVTPAVKGLPFMMDNLHY